MARRLTYEEIEGYFMAGAWVGCLEWAIKCPEVVAQFKEATGHDLSHRSTIEAMIDRATGHDVAVVTEFVDWVTDNYWGIDDAPPSYRKDRARREHERNRPRKKRTGSG